MCLLSGIDLAQQSQLNGKTKTGEFPEETALAYVTENDSFKTGATLISKQHALAGAQSVYMYIPRKYDHIRVVAGVMPCLNEGGRHRISRIDTSDGSNENNDQPPLHKELAVITVSFTPNSRFPTRIG